MDTAADAATASDSSSDVESVKAPTELLAEVNFLLYSLQYFSS